LLSSGICVSYQPLGMSSRLIRRLQSPLCSGKAPCHVYLTYPENARTSIIVNFHTAEIDFQNSANNPVVVYYDTVSHAGQEDDSLETLYAHSSPASTCILVYLPNVCLFERYLQLLGSHPRNTLDTNRKPQTEHKLISFLVSYLFM
jgi:hypothetical protein